MPRANKITAMKTATVVKDGQGVFYWPDTGPVQYRAEGGFIVRGDMIEERDDDLPSSWRAGA